MKNQLVDFDLRNDMAVAYTGQAVPEHTQEALENYLIRGYQPGGFLTACLSGDLFRAMQSADHTNRNAIYAIVRWIMTSAPEGSWGSYPAVEDWCADKHGRRTQYREQCEKRLAWLTLVK